MDRLSWIYAIVWFLVIQLLSRLITSPDLNVNLAHHMQPGWEQRFDAYWQFWLTMILVISLGLWLLSLVLRWVWPSEAQVMD
jgi:hypothetical protein